MQTDQQWRHFPFIHAYDLLPRPLHHHLHHHLPHHHHHHPLPPTAHIVALKLVDNDQEVL